MKNAKPTMAFATPHAGSHLPTNAGPLSPSAGAGAGSAGAGAGAASCLPIIRMIPLATTAAGASAFGSVVEALKAATAAIALSHRTVNNRSKTANAYALPQARERSNQRVMEL